MRITSLPTRPCAPALLCLLMIAMPLPAQSEDDEAAVHAMEQQCEVAREAKLKPMREAEIARCKEEGKDPGYCERYWSDLGNAVRLPNGSMKPRMFDDLPECVAADEARRKLAND
jgi:hypothetical protein